MGALRPNTAVIGYKQNWKQCSLQQVEEYEQLLFDVMVSGVRSEQQPQSVPSGNVIKFVSLSVLQRADLGLCVVRDENEFFKDPVRVGGTLTPTQLRRDLPVLVGPPPPIADWCSHDDEPYPVTPRSV